MKLVADFETIVRENDCRVWAYGICEVGNVENFTYGNNIEDFFKFCKKKKENHIIYFHNLKFDGMFIMDYLFNNDFTHVTDKKQIKSNTFTTLISDMGQFYKIEVYFKKDVNNKNTNKVTFLDSKKMLNFSVDQIAKSFKLPLRKLKLGMYSPSGPFKKTRLNIFNKNMIIDKDREYHVFNDSATNFKLIKKNKCYCYKNLKYKRKKQNILKMDFGYKGFRPVNHVITKEELEYLKHDCQVMGMAIQIMFDFNLLKMTIGSDALNEYKEVITEKSFKLHFPAPSLGQDKDIRKSYRGGFTYLNPKYKNCIVNGGIVLDVNSLYPSVMYNERLPYGKPLFYNGKYKDDKLYPLYMQVITCQFKLKKGKVPTIQIKDKNLRYNPTEYLTSSMTLDGVFEAPTLFLTKPDLELFLENYDIYNETYHCGYKFKSSTKLFKKYIDKWIGIKIKARQEGNAAMYQISKLMLNSLYGKFGTNPKVRSKNPYFDEISRKVKFDLGKEEERNPIYIAMATFITSYARCKTIRAAQQVYHRFIYADTDSLHLEGYDIPENLDIDRDKLGYWKHEFTFDKGKYLRQKSYMEYGKDPEKDEPKYLKIVCAGMTKKSYKYVNFNNFRIGASFKGKLQPKIVPGGTILKDVRFTIKENVYF